MSETKHTPLPWKHDEHFPTALWASDIWIGSMSVEAIFLEEATGNAKLAVEAVNNYDSLRSTVRTLAEALRYVNQWWEETDQASENWHPSLKAKIDSALSDPVVQQVLGEK